MTKFEVEPLTCSKLDFDWTMKIPPVTNANIQTVSVQMETETEIFLHSPNQGLVYLN